MASGRNFDQDEKVDRTRPCDFGWVISGYATAGFYSQSFGFAAFQVIGFAAFQVIGFWSAGLPK